MKKLGAFIIYTIVTYVLLFGFFYITGDLPAKTKEAEFWHGYGMLFWCIGVICSWFNSPVSGVSEYSDNIGYEPISPRDKNRGEVKVGAHVDVYAVLEENGRLWREICELRTQLRENGIYSESLGLRTEGNGFIRNGS